MLGAGHAGCKGSPDNRSIGNLLQKGNLAQEGSGANSKYSTPYRGVWSDGVVQLGYKAPIKPAHEKWLIVGIPGVARRSGFEAKCAAAEAVFFVVYKTN